MSYRIPIQIIRESTLRLDDDNRFGQRQLTPLSNRMWNLASALYYKGGGKPWRLAGARDGVCYVGLAFRRYGEVDVEKSESRTAACAAQMFLDDGDGIVFLGNYGPWYSPRNKQYHLTADAAHDLLKGVLKTYTQLHGKALTEVFLHSRSDISAHEFDGYRSRRAEWSKASRYSCSSSSRRPATLSSRQTVAGNSWYTVAAFSNEVRICLRRASNQDSELTMVGRLQYHFRLIFSMEMRISLTWLVIFWGLRS